MGKQSLLQLHPKSRSWEEVFCSYIERNYHPKVLFSHTSFQIPNISQRDLYFAEWCSQSRRTSDAGSKINLPDQALFSEPVWYSSTSKLHQWNRWSWSKHSKLHLPSEVEHSCFTSPEVEVIYPPMALWNPNRYFLGPRPRVCFVFLPSTDRDEFPMAARLQR